MERLSAHAYEVMAKDHCSNERWQMAVDCYVQARISTNGHTQRARYTKLAEECARRAKAAK